MAVENQNIIWPLPKFHFKVEFEGGITAFFQEVSGLDTDTDVVEYRHGESPPIYTISMPGIKKSSVVTLKKGIFTGDVTFVNWINDIKLNTIERKTVTILLLDESGDPVMKWILLNAFPIQIQSTELNSTSSEVAVETLVLQHEGITISGS